MAAGRRMAVHWPGVPPLPVRQPKPRAMPDDPSASDRSPVALSLPAAPALPLVVASPHSGREYDPEFLAQTRLDADVLRRSEDAYVDRLFAGAPAEGAPLLAARFPRIYIDANREPFELDPDMFAEPLPRWVNPRSPRVRNGLGLIPRLGANGAPVYGGPLSRADARRRLVSCYLPYHRALKRLLRETRAAFGHAVLLDCHSMPSQAVARPVGWSLGAERGVDFVLGDRHGAACHPALTAAAETVLRRLGYSVVRNAPYAGGFTTRRYGRPRRGVQALQIEINRALYLDEARTEPNAGFAPLKAAIDRLIVVLGTLYPLVRAAE